MNINLRKSAAIQQEILRTIKSLAERKAEVAYNEFDQNIGESFANRRNEFLANQKLIADLYRVYYTLRDNTAQLNQDVGINKLLNEIELSKKLLDQELRLKSLSPAMELEEINQRLDKIRNAEKNDFYYEKTVASNCVTVADINAAEQQVTILKQRIRDLSDLLLERNIQTKFTLDLAQYQILVQAGICN